MWKSPYNYLFFLGLVVTLICAFYSEGFHHPDEHFQILEFANYKLGNSPASQLTWEYEARERPTIQPSVAVLIITVVQLTGIDNPFVHALVLRLMTGLLGWFIISKISLLLLQDFSTERGKHLFILIGQVLWFVPYINVRFSAENLGGLTLLIAVYLILMGTKQNARRQSMLTLGAGLLVGLSFFFRFQIAFSIVGLGVWLLMVKQFSYRQWLVLVAAGLLGGVLCILVDSWFYGETVLTPYIYFYIQIVQDKVSNAGVSAWWTYITNFVILATPPLGIPLLIGLVIGIYKKPTSVFVFMLVPFVIGHMMVGHKEMRFMFPILFSFIYLVSIGFDHLISRYPHSGRGVRLTFLGMQGINLLLLGLAIFLPAQEAISYYRKLYYPVGEQRITLASLGDSPYRLVGAEANFYKPPEADIKVFSDYQEIDRYLHRLQPKSLLILSKDPVLNYDFEQYKKERIFSLFPDWLLDVKLNSWQKEQGPGVFIKSTGNDDIMEGPAPKGYE